MPSVSVRHGPRVCAPTQLACCTEPITAAQRQCMLVLLYAGGIAQLLAGMWEARRGKIFGATAFSSYGAFWISYGLFGILSTVSPCCAVVKWSGTSACCHHDYKVACGPENHTPLGCEACPFLMQSAVINGGAATPIPSGLQMVRCCTELTK